MSDWRPTDLGLTYEEALHGVQTAIAHGMNESKKATDPKHMRTGIDATKAEMGGLVMLLISKGVFTSEEYLEAMRLAMNTELAMREREYNGKYSFR